MRTGLRLSNFVWTAEAEEMLVGLYVDGNSHGFIIEQLTAQFGGLLTVGGLSGKINRAGLTRKPSSPGDTHATPRERLGADGSASCQAPVRRPIEAAAPRKNAGQVQNGLGLRLPDRPSTMAVRERAKPLPPVRSAEVAALPNVPDEPEALTVATLKGFHCRWPTEQAGPRATSFTFCGDHRAEGLPYCAAHARLAYSAPNGRLRPVAGWT